MKAGLGWEDFERPDKDEFEKFIRVCKLFSHPNPIVMLNRKYAVAKLKNGGFELVFAMDVTDTQTGVTEERWFGTDIGLSEFSQLCQTASEEEIIEAMANKVLNEVKLGKMAKVVGIDNSKKKRITHSDCGAIIEYFQNEVISKVENEPYGGGTDTYYYLKCPHCGKMIRWC